MSVASTEAHPWSADDDCSDPRGDRSSPHACPISKRRLVERPNRSAATPPPHRPRSLCKDRPAPVTPLAPNPGTCPGALPQDWPKVAIGGAGDAGGVVTGYSLLQWWSPPCTGGRLGFPTNPANSHSLKTGLARDGQIISESNCERHSARGHGRLPLSRGKSRVLRPGRWNAWASARIAQKLQEMARKPPTRARGNANPGQLHWIPLGNPARPPLEPVVPVACPFDLRSD